MSRPARPSWRWRNFGVFWILAACGGSPAPTTTPPPSEPAPRVEEPPRAEVFRGAFVGDLPPRDVAEPVRSQVIAHGRIGSFRLLGLHLDSSINAPPTFAENEAPLTPDWGQFTLRSAVDAPGARVHFALTRRPAPQAANQAAPRETSTPTALRAVSNQIWLLVPEERVASLDVRWIVEGVQGPASRFVVQLPALGDETPGFRDEYAQAFREYLASVEPSSFSVFARSRLGGADWLDSRADSSHDSSPFAEVLRSSALHFSGHSSIEKALVYRPTNEIRQVMRPSVPLSRLQAPRVARHEWELMRTQLGRTAPEVPIARAVPKRFYLLHARSGEALFRALDELERFATPALHFLEPESFRADVSERYQTELGLLRGPLARRFGPSAIEEMAVVGSDPFLRRGSDLTVIFKPKNSALLQAGLAASLAELSETCGPLTDKTERIGTRSVRLTTSADGRVRRFEVSSQGYVILSNSRGALTEVLETLDGKRPALASEPDFLYMMARDAERVDDVLVYAGDAFIESVASPRSRVLDVRRSLAWSELRRVGYADLLQALFSGKFGASGGDLVAQKWLDKSQLQHFDGSAIHKDASAPARSNWGTPRRLTPIIDLPTPTTVSSTELEIYEEFTRSYEAAWSDALDPIALRVRFSEQGVRTHLRILPMVRDRDYQSLRELVGRARLDRGAPGLGVRLAFPIDEDSSLRRELEGLSQGFLGERLSLGWVGDFVFVGVADEPSLERALGDELAPSGPQPHSGGSSFESWTELPLYFGIHVKNRTQAGIFLGFATRFLLGDKAHAEIEERPEHRGVAIYRAPLKDFTRSLSVYYALGRETLLFALEEGVLHQLLDREAEGLGPSRATAARPSQQISLDLSLRERGPLFNVLSWSVQDDPTGSPSSHDFAELASWALDASKENPPNRVLLETFGERPVTRDGLEYQTSPVGLVDPAWGNRLHPRWPDIPVQGSDWAHLLEALAQLRSTLAFDAEAPGTQRENISLSIEMDLSHRNAAQPSGSNGH